MIAAMACLRAVIFNIEIPSKTPRQKEFKHECAKKAAEIKVQEFKVDESAAKAIQSDIDKQDNKEEKKE